MTGNINISEAARCGRRPDRAAAARTDRNRAAHFASYVYVFNLSLLGYGIDSKRWHRRQTPSSSGAGTPPCPPSGRPRIPTPRSSNGDINSASHTYPAGIFTEEALEGIAYNICDTDQRYCSSCQGIYLDTDDMDEVYRFAERFLHTLDKTALSMDRPLGLALRAQKTLELYTEELESIGARKKVYRTERCSAIAHDDSRLEPSYMFRNCWEKPLPAARLIPALLPYKNRLQTAALDLRRTTGARELEEALLKTGLVRRNERTEHVGKLLRYAARRRIFAATVHEACFARIYRYAIAALTA